MKNIMVGIDLHSNNLMIALVDMQGQRLGHKSCPCRIEEVAKYLALYRDRIDTIAVESTFNWYWLVDALMDLSYKVALANPARFQQYEGIKHANDKTDAYWLADMLRLGVLPLGYIYPREFRADRDLLRRRALLVGQRTALLLSSKSLFQRMTGTTISADRIYSMTPVQAQELYQNPSDKLVACLEKELIDKLTHQITLIEHKVLNAEIPKAVYAQLIKLPGIGRILGMTIAMEIGEISRFASPEDFCSYARTVSAKRLSNGKKKGDNNRKCGNKYLSWAFVEAANFARRFDDDCRSWYDRKAAKTKPVIATKALACKLAKAAWHLVKEGGEYDPQRIFPGAVLPGAKEFEAQPSARSRG